MRSYWLPKLKNPGVSLQAWFVWNSAPFLWSFLGSPFFRVSILPQAGVSYVGKEISIVIIQEKDNRWYMITKTKNKTKSLYLMLIWVKQKLIPMSRELVWTGLCKPTNPCGKRHKFTLTGSEQSGPTSNIWVFDLSYSSQWWVVE